MFLLVDCNNFFVSCERVFRPDLRDKPVVVLSSNDGCIIARSNESKALGIAMGEPFFKVRPILQRNNVAVFSSNMALYADFSRRVMSVLRSVAPSIEVYSIDEAFLNFNGVKEGVDLVEYAQKIVDVVGRGCGIPISIGIASTKTLAKLAAVRVKKNIEGSHGVCYLSDNEQIKIALSQTSVGDVWGIGRKSVVDLKRNGIETALDFLNTSPSWINYNMSVTGLRTWNELAGRPSIEFSPNDASKSITVSRSFTREITDFETLSTALAAFVTSATQKLRRQKSVVGQITVYVQSGKFSTDTFFSESRVHKFEVATDALTEIISISIPMLKNMIRVGVGYKKAGVLFSALTPKDNVRNSLFDEIDRTKQNSLMNIVDDINSRSGKDTIASARRGFDKLP
ncbi:MAG: SOS mutagenesis and repair protein UmuC, partial [Rikenellaceae bacterium]